MRIQQLVVMTLVLTFGGTVRAQDEGTMRQDAEQLHAAAQRVRALGNSSDWTLSEYTMETIGQNLPRVQQVLAKQDEALRLADQTRPFVDEFRSRYTARLESWQDPGNALNNRFASLGLSFQIGQDYWDVSNFLRDLPPIPARNARRCTEILEQNGTDEQRIRNLHELYRTRAIVEARGLLDVCPRLDPTNAEIQRRIDELRPRVADVLARFREEEIAAIRDREWQSSTGPSAQVGPALEFLRSDPRLGGSTTRPTQVLAVSVRGDFAVAERNLLGMPTSYGLPVHVAIVSPDTVEGVAQVLELTLITREPRPSPPYDGFWVGNTWLMLREKVPGQRAAPAPSGGAPSSSASSPSGMPSRGGSMRR